jgi:hypothetical protein
MPTSVHDHPALHSPASGRSPTIERAAPIPFPTNDDDLYELMRAESAWRFAELRATLREAKCATARRPETEPDSLIPTAATLQAVTRYYEQHVLAWYALGRVREARAAREAIAHCQQALSAENGCNEVSPTDHRTTVIDHVYSAGEARIEEVTNVPGPGVDRSPV